MDSRLRGNDGRSAPCDPALILTMDSRLRGNDGRFYKGLLGDTSTTQYLNCPFLTLSIVE